jgi:hypothetical protein
MLQQPAVALASTAFTQQVIHVSNALCSSNFQSKRMLDTRPERCAGYNTELLPNYITANQCQSAAFNCNDLPIFHQYCMCARSHMHIIPAAAFVAQLHITPTAAFVAQLTGAPCTRELQPHAGQPAAPRRRITLTRVKHTHILHATKH